MKFLSIILLLLASAFGQSTSAGGAISTGNVTTNTSGQIGGGCTQNCGPPPGNTPLTYAARVDTCLNRTDKDLSNGGVTCGVPLELTFQGRNTCGLGCNGTAWTDAAPNVGGLNGKNTVINEPDLGTTVVRATDYSLNAVGSSFSSVSTGNQNMWSIDSKLFFASNNGGGKILFAFSADSAMTVTLTGIHGQNVGGDCGGPATTTPCTGAVHFVQGANINFSSVDPLVIYELDSNNYSGTFVNQLNKLTIVKNTPSDPSTWTMTRVKMFNYACEGASCPVTSATENFVNGYNIGTSSHNCLLKGYRPNWSGTVSPSADDSHFAIAWSDDGQGGGPNPAKGKQGAIFITSWTQGKGCRLYVPWLGQVVSADWGPIGQIVTYDGVTPLLDKFFLHEAGTVADSKYVGISPAAQATCANSGDPAHCSYACVFGKAGGNCESYIWEVSSLIVRPCDAQCFGHQATGYLYYYRGKQYRSHSFGFPDQPLTPLLTDPLGFPGDNHGSYNNAGLNDLPPVLLAITNVCGQAPGVQGNGACDPAYTGPRYNEIIGVENPVGNAGNDKNAFGMHCNYGSGPTPCVYRLAQTYNTGTQWQFSTQNAITNVSPDGHWAMFPSDWNGTLGCTNNTTTCLDSISDSLRTVGAMTQVSMDGSNNLTVTYNCGPPDCKAPIAVGEFVTFAGTGLGWIDGNGVTVTSATSTSFVGTGITRAAETDVVVGTATWNACTGSNVSLAACQRSDIFIADITTAHGVNGKSGSLGEAFAQNDSLAVVKSTGGGNTKAVFETFGQLDTVSLRRGVTKSIVETFSQIDSVLRGTGKCLLETFGQSDTIAISKNGGSNNKAVAITDTFTQADAVTAVTGLSQTFRPTSFQDIGTEPTLTPANAYDGNISTAAVITGNNDGAGVVTSGQIIYSFGSTFGGSPTSVVLSVTSQTQKSSGCTPFVGRVQYSTNSGSTFTNVPNQGGTHNLRTDTISLSTAQDLTKLQIQAIDACGNPSGSSSATISLYEAFVTVQ